MFNNKHMASAIAMAEKAFSQAEVPVGAIILDPLNKKIIAQSYNLVEEMKDPTAHAEMLVIKSACQYLETKNLAGLDLYVTLQPCLMCLQAMIYAKIRRVYFGAYDQDMPIIDVMHLPSTNHIVDVYGGIMEAECKNLLNRFFASKR